MFPLQTEFFHPGRDIFQRLSGGVYLRFYRIQLFFQFPAALEKSLFLLCRGVRIHFIRFDQIVQIIVRQFVQITVVFPDQFALCFPLSHGEFQQSAAFLVGKFASSGSLSGEAAAVTV